MELRPRGDERCGKVRAVHLCLKDFACCRLLVLENDQIHECQENDGKRGRPAGFVRRSCASRLVRESFSALRRAEDADDWALLRAVKIFERTALDNRLSPLC